MNKQYSYTYQKLISHTKGDLLVDKNAQLPLSPMFMTDPIVKICDGDGEFSNGLIIDEFNIKPDLWFFDCHFHNDPVMTTTA